MMLRFSVSLCVLSVALAALGCSGSDGADPQKTGDPPDPGPNTKGCGLDTGWPGDEFCILPPPEDEGFQVHWGPSDYADEAEINKYLIAPGIDTNVFEGKTAGNTTDIYFYKREYRMRRGSHHLIVSAAGAGSGSILGMGRRLGGSQNVIKDNPTGRMPPENVGIGMPLAALSPLTLNLHHFNSTAEPLLREAWINFWYVDPSTVTQEAKEMFLWAQGGAIAPGARATVRGRRVIDMDGRVLTMYGHRHSNNVRFSAYRVRGDDREIVYDDYNWEEPAVLEFNSLTSNPVPNPTAKSTGGHSGILDLKAGDALEWECEIINNHSVEITFGENEAATSEMCILVGDAIGPTLLGIGVP